MESLSDEELFVKILGADEWEDDLVRDLCWRADLDDEYEALDDLGEYALYHEPELVKKAANILGIRLPNPF